MSPPPFRRILVLTLISLIFSMTSCDTGVVYTPPFGFVSLRIGTDGISVHASSPNLETPIGTFNVDLSTLVSDANNQQPADNGLLVIIRYYKGFDPPPCPLVRRVGITFPGDRCKQATLIDDVHQINTGGSNVVVTADGQITMNIEIHRDFVDASKSNVETIEVNNPDSSSSN